MKNSVWGIALKAGTLQATQVFGNRQEAEDAIATISHLSNGFEAVELGPVNSPELPDGWKLVPIDLINDLRNAAHFEKASYAASFGSHIDTGRWKDEYEQLTATCKAVDELLAPPTTEK